MLERVRERLGGVAHSISGRGDEGCTDALAIKCDVSHAHACRRLWKVQQGIRLKTPGCPQRSSGQPGVSTGLARWYSCGTADSPVPTADSGKAVSACPNRVAGVIPASCGFGLPARTS